MAYDTKCYDLAAAFLEDSPGATEGQRHKLAKHIQSTIENWLLYDDDAPPSTRAQSMPVDDEDHMRCCGTTEPQYTCPETVR